MRLFAAIVLLFLGLIATTTARSFSSSQQEEDDESSSSVFSQLQELLDDIQIACYNYHGSNDTYKSFVSHFYAIPVCVKMNWNVEKFVDDLDKLNKFTRFWFFPKYCPQIRSALQCLETPLKKVQRCFHEDDDEVALFRVIGQALPEALDLLCDKNGALLFAENTDYKLCFDNFTDYIDQCNVTLSKETEKMRIAKYGPSQCDEVANFRTCLEAQMNLCNGPRLMDVFDVLYRAFARASPCSNFIAMPGEKEDNTLDEEENAIRQF